MLLKNAQHSVRCEHRISSHELFTKLQLRMSESGSLAAEVSDRGRRASVQIPGMEVRVLRRVEDLGTGVRRISADQCVGVPLPGDFSGNNHFIVTSTCEMKPHARAYSANGSSQNIL
jgi:hypothetical protein